jgi:hypothetical protein
MTVKTKDVQIGQSTFQLSSFSPRDGSWIASQFLLRGLLQQLDNPNEEITEKQLGAALAASFSTFSEETFNRIQAKCYAVVKRYEDQAGQRVPMPLVMLDGPRKGEWAGAPLDLVDALALTVAALVFNLYAFFVDGALEKLLTVFPDLSALREESTITSSAQ